MKPPLYAVCSLAGALVAGAAVAQEVGSTPVADPIVITAQSLSTTQDALAACVARRCPPDEDIAATLAHADNLFVSGDYEGARTVLRHSIRRNRDEAGRYPLWVSELYRGAATVDLHLGERDSYVRKVAEVRDALRAGLPDTDARVAVAQLEVGDMRAKLGYPEEAERYYDDVFRRAERNGQPMLAALARIRHAWLSMSRAEKGAEGADGLRAEAGRILHELIDGRTGAADPRIRLAALPLLARLERTRGEHASADALIAAARAQAVESGERPRLITAAPLRDPLAEAAAEQVTHPATFNAPVGRSTTRLISRNMADQWVDMGFWVRPNGRVAEVTVLRSSGTVDWLEPVMRQLGTRLYSRTNAEPGAPGYYMVERYTLTADWTSQVTGSHLRQRSPVRRIERVDLLSEQPPA